MKKEILTFLFILFAINIVFAVGIGQKNSDNSSENNLIGGQKDENGCLTSAGYSWNSSEKQCVREWLRDKDRYQNNSGIGKELREQIRERKEEIKSGEYNGSLGQLLRVREMAHNLKELRVNNYSAQTSLNITAQSDENGTTTFSIRMRNGSQSEIKIMPDSASQRALERLRLKNCSSENNCTIQLKNVGSESNEKIGYEIQIQRHSKILGIFQKKMQVSAQVDAQNGEIIQEKKPWWAFIASEPEE